MQERGTTFPLLDLAPQKGFDRARAAFGDIRDGVRLLPLAVALGWLDIKTRYRGSVLGPLWLTLSTAVMVGAMGVVYGYLFHQDMTHYLPFLSLSMVLWGFISAVVTESAGVFTQSAPLFHSRRIPATLPALRLIVRNVLMLAHNVVVIVAVFLFYRVWPKESWSLLLSLPVWLLDSLSVIMLIGMLGARFRDIGPITASLMQIFFFVTPVIWKPDLIYLGRQYLLLDPFYPVLEIVRGPLLGYAVRPSLWYAAIMQAVLLWTIAMALFCRMRARIPYWV